MFSIVFLELKSLTKISDDKSSKDLKIGFSVVMTTFVSYMLIYLPFFIPMIASSDPQTN